MSGRLGTCVSEANTNHQLYTAPDNVRLVTVNILAVNTSAEVATVYVAISQGDVPNQEDWVEYGSKLPANGGILERSCFLLSAAERFIVRSDIDGVVFRLNGLEAL